MALDALSWLQRSHKVMQSVAVLACLTLWGLGKDFEKIINKHWYILSSDPSLKNVFNNPPSVVYKRPPNLRQMLVKSDLIPAKKQTFLDLPFGNYRCGSCTQCNFTYKCTTYNHPITGKTMKIKGTISCSTKNVIYLIKCPCGLASDGDGETERKQEKTVKSAL